MNGEYLQGTKAEHGEGPAWDARDGVLYWVDITSSNVHCLNPESGEDRVFDTGTMVGAVAPRAAGGLVAALADGFAFVDTETGAVSRVADPESDVPENRFNDGKCDPAGRFWAGTMSQDGSGEGAGSLYRFDPDRSVSRILEGITISNGLCWSPDSNTMYFIDTPTFEVWAFDYEIATGEIGNKRVVVRIPEEVGFPDGMTGDSEGMLWVAHWGGSCVCRWNPVNGDLLETVRFPAAQVSSCAFGGSDLTAMFVTTSRMGLDSDAMRQQPLAGGVFRVETGVRGAPTYPFAG